MPRKSTAALSVAPPISASHEVRLVVPAGLTPSEAQVWDRTTAALPADYFGGDQGPLLERYCKHVVRAQCLENMLAAVDPVASLGRYAKLARLCGEETGRLLAVARALRLTNQSRLKAETAWNRAAKPGRVDHGRAIARLTGVSHGT